MWLGTQSGGAQETNSTTFRNFGFVVAGVLALAIAIWRGIVADKQAKAAQLQAQIALSQAETAQAQAETARIQAETAQRSLLNERYQRCAEMLGSEVLAVRLGGIYALNRLATEYPEQYHIQVMELFCAFVRTPIGQEPSEVEFLDKNGDTYRDVLPREDVQAIVDVMKKRTQEMLAAESEKNFRIWLDFADLTAVRFFDVDLNHASLWGANLTKACFWGTNLLHASLEMAILNHASFSYEGEDPAINLTQWQLDRARASTDCLPSLDGVLDVETGEQLVWNGKDLTQ